MYHMKRPLACLTQFTVSLIRVNRTAAVQFVTAKNHETQRESASEKVDKIQKNQDKLKPKITLLLSDSSMMVVTLDEAQKMSRRREMKLLKIDNLDLKIQRPTYRLMTNAEFKEEQLNFDSENVDKQDKRHNIKGEKLLQLNRNIGAADLLARIKNATKWLTKNYKVIAVISGGSSDNSASEKIFREIESSTKSIGKIVQKRINRSDIRFQINPVPPGNGGDDDKKTS
ncbi:uncharacterized protein DMENIID0001_143410 [Sergentomyia squamirostris]